MHAGSTKGGGVQNCPKFSPVLNLFYVDVLYTGGDFLLTPSPGSSLESPSRLKAPECPGGKFEWAPELQCPPSAGVTSDGKCAEDSDSGHNFGSRVGFRGSWVPRGGYKVRIWVSLCVMSGGRVLNCPP